MYTTATINKNLIDAHQRMNQLEQGLNLKSLEPLNRLVSHIKPLMSLLQSPEEFKCAVPLLHKIRTQKELLGKNIAFIGQQTLHIAPQKRAKISPVLRQTQIKSLFNDAKSLPNDGQLEEMKRNYAEVDKSLRAAQRNFVLSEMKLLPPSLGKKILEAFDNPSIKSLNLSSETEKLTFFPFSITYLTQLETLNLYKQEIESLPAEIGHLTGLRSLQLSHNSLKTLPAEIGRLTQLEDLQVAYNDLKELPAEIGGLTNLKFLELNDNQLSQLPDEIGKLAKAVKLDVSRNQLTTLPAEIGGLTEVRELIVEHNQLVQLPSEICALKQLRSLRLGNNKLEKTIFKTISQLSQLTALALESNNLTEVTADIGKLTGLSLLILNDNRLTGLPSEITALTKLTALNLKGNMLTTIPPALLLLQKLYRIDLSKNPFTAFSLTIFLLPALFQLDMKGNSLSDTFKEEAIQAWRKSHVAHFVYE